MLYRKFGKTNEMVSVLGFGCMRLPIIDKNPNKIDEDEAIKLVRYAIDNGVNYIDTAYPYHGTGMATGGASEPFLAKALKDGYRERIKLATKLPSWLIKNREDMDKYLNEQLDRLQTDSIDFYLVHALNASTWNALKKEGIIEFLDQAIKDGRIKYAGFSFHDKINVFKEIVDEYDWSFCLIQYNYIDENIQAGKEGLQYAADKGLGIAIMEPLRGGSIVKGLPKEAKEVFDKADVKRSSAEWGLKWVWNHPEVSVVLSGMSAMDNVEENIDIAKDAHPNSLSENDINVIENVKNILKERIKVNCTGCSYCMPCLAGVDIPKNFFLYNDYHLFDDENKQARYKNLYNFSLKSEEKASKCVGCHKCEEHCPQSISISEELKNVKELLE